MNENIKISFIIVNYKSADYLPGCISSLKKKIRDIDYETIIVNNNDGELRTGLLDGVKVINKGENIGYGAGCNAGAKIAKGEILCFLNPDTEVVSENIQDPLNEFGKDNKLVIIGPKLLSDKNEVQWWCAGKEITLFNTILNNLGYKRDKKIWESPKKIGCAWVSGAALLIRKDIFGKLGGFDEKFFMYFEDIDLCKRVRNLGHKVLYYPNFVVRHFGGKSFIDNKMQKKYFYTSQDYYFGKHFRKLIVQIIRFLRLFHPNIN